MGKRVAIETQHVPPPATRTIRKRKNTSISASVVKSPRLTTNHNLWHENDDEDSSSNDGPLTPVHTLQHSSKHANNLSILINASLNTTGEEVVNESPKPIYTLRPSVVNGTILHDLIHKPWRLGRPIGKGNFGEIFLASDNITIPVTNENAKFVVKIEPHSNGPLFVEIHCLMNTAKKNRNEEENKTNTTLLRPPPTGIPDYIASGSHLFGDARYRFLVLQRFDRDLHSIIKNCRVSEKYVLTLAIQIVNVLENLHDKGYCHNDVKAQNLMISKCKYNKENGSVNIKNKYDENYDEKQQTTDSGNSSEQEANYEYDDFVAKRKTYDDEDYDEDFDDGTTSNSNNSNMTDMYHTPMNKNSKRRSRNAMIEFSGSNPVRSCRLSKRNTMYEEMVKSHYLRPTKRVSYSEFFTEDGTSVKEDSNDTASFSDNDSEEFVPHSKRRSNANKKNTPSAPTIRRLTRRQEKLLANSSGLNQERNQRSRCFASSAAEPKDLAMVEEERIFLIDFGLASKFMDNGVHRPFIMDQRRAHDGTLEFTSRDAHMGAHSRRSDLECLGYNLLFWSQGYLPWKDAASQHQQEKVHRVKECFMKDVREMLKQIYGKQVPKYLGEFLHQVGQLAHHERPDYTRYRRIFEREYQQLGYNVSQMQLDSNEIGRTCERIKEEIENKFDIFETNKHTNTLSIMKNISVGTPFHECTISNRVSPKNLRSKSDKKTMKKKKFSWAEILSQDPDQIARERAEKEFEREDELGKTQQPTVRRYEGNPTYAILEIQQRLKYNSRSRDECDNDSATEDEEMEADEDELQENTESDMSIKEEEDEDDDDEEGDKESEESEDEDMETDSTEINEKLQENEKIRTNNKKTVTTIMKGGRNVANRKKNSTIKSRNSTNAPTTVVEIYGKRKTTSRYRRSSNTNGQAASAAGEIIANTPRFTENGHVLYGDKPSWRRKRKRRCLIKTDADVEEEENTASYSPDVRGLFNVWNKFHDPIYFRRAEATKHCKK